MKIFDRLTIQFDQKLPFVVYRKPNANSVLALLGNDQTEQKACNFEESGFVFAPFDHQKDAIIFSRDAFQLVEECMGSFSVHPSANGTELMDSDSKKNHIQLVEKAIQEIENGTFDKLVITRKESHAYKDFDAIEIFKRLLSKYINAFVYLWYHPKLGLWMGASPETLLRIENSTIKTVALAGTQSVTQNDTVIWGKKEIEEQQLVVDFIASALKDKVGNLEITDRQTIKAGSLYHLKSVISGDIQNHISLAEVIEALHPTPAVCGVPKEKSKKFILKNEGYDRSYYTGFLGELNFNPKTKEKKFTHLFVNLRCMEFTEGNVNLYVGGGITKDSNLEKEWEETVFKTRTMKSVL